MKVGLALGGGAARGMAHIGILDILSSANIPIHCVSGCSVGSVVGALYCAGYSMSQIRSAVPSIHWRRIVQKANPGQQGLMNLEKMERLLVMMIGEIDFCDLELPFGVVTMDFETGERVVINSGPVAKAVRASCSVPGFIAPVPSEGRWLVDGGIVDNLPVDLARELGADYVIGADIFQPDYQRDSGPLGTGLTTIETLIRNAGGGAGRADFLIYPDTAGKSFVQFSRHQELIQVGERAAQACLPDLITDLRERGFEI